MDAEKYRIVQPNTELEGQIVRVFESASEPIRLSDIIDELVPRPQPAQIRQSLWRLIENGQIEILNDRSMRLQK